MSSIKPPVTVTRPVSDCLSVDKPEGITTLRAKGITDDALTLDQVPQGVLTLLAQLQPRTDQALKLGFKPQHVEPQLSPKSIDKKRDAKEGPEPAEQVAMTRVIQPVMKTPTSVLPPQPAPAASAVAQPMQLIPEAPELLQANDDSPLPLQPPQYPSQEAPVVTGVNIQGMPVQGAPSMMPPATDKARSAASPVAGNGAVPLARTASVYAPQPLAPAKGGALNTPQQERVPVNMGLSATGSHPAILGELKVASTAQPAAALPAGNGSLSLPEVGTQAQSNPPFPVPASSMSLVQAALMPKPLPSMMPLAAAPQADTVSTPARALPIEPLTKTAELHTGLPNNLPEPRDQVVLYMIPPTSVPANPAREPAVLGSSGASTFTAEPLVKPEALTDKGPQHYLQVPFAKGDASSMITITKGPADQPQQLLLRPDNADVSGYLGDRLAQVEEPRWRMADSKEREHEHAKGNDQGEQDEEQEEGGQRFFGAQREPV